MYKKCQKSDSSQCQVHSPHFCHWDAICNCAGRAVLHVVWLVCSCTAPFISGQLIFFIYLFFCFQRDRKEEKLKFCLTLFFSSSPSFSTPNRWTPGSGLTWPAPLSSFSSSASSRSSSFHRESIFWNTPEETRRNMPPLPAPVFLIKKGWQ